MLRLSKQLHINDEVIDGQETCCRHGFALMSLHGGGKPENKLQRSAQNAAEAGLSYDVFFIYREVPIFTIASFSRLARLQSISEEFPLLGISPLKLTKQSKQRSSGGWCT